MTDQFKERVNHMVNLLQSHPTWSEWALNVLLVMGSGRQAYLFETSEYMDDDIPSILDNMKKMNLCIQRDPLSDSHYPRYWVTQNALGRRLPNTHRQIGELLGMKYPGGRFSDYQHKRLFLHIHEKQTGCQIMAEQMKGDQKDVMNREFARNRVKRFNCTMVTLGLPYRYKAVFEQDDGTLRRRRELENQNIRYMRSNQFAYRDDLWNMGDTDALIDMFFRVLRVPTTERKQLLHQYIPVFLFSYDLINHTIGKQWNDSDKVKQLNKMFRKAKKKK